MSFIQTLPILGLILLFIIYHTVYTYSDVEYMLSDIDNKTYMIRRGKNKSLEFLKESANTLALINRRIELLISMTLKKYKNDMSKIYFLNKLKQNYNPYKISEAYIDPRYTTYTIDKQDLHICLRTRDANEHIYDMNTLMYVCIHELAHMGNYSRDGTAIIGHGNEFKMVFKFLVQEAMKLGLYNYVDYKNVPVEYCKIVINSQIA